MEEWRECNGFSKYLISNKGIIKNVNTNKLRKQDLVDGYSFVSLYNSNMELKRVKIHNLVAKTFIKNPNNYKTVDHIDGNRNNNCVENLRWASHKLQAQNRRKVLKMPNKYRSVVKMSPEGNELEVYKSIQDASYDTKGKASHIIAVCKGKRNFCGGFKWKYEDIQNLDKEIWKTCELLDPDILVSNMGRVKSNKKQLLYKGAIKCGYRRVKVLDNSNNHKYFYVHRLVAQTFIENDKKYDIVNHLDGDKANNIYSNLEWTDHSGNIKHAYDNNLIKNRIAVIQYDKNGIEINRFKSISDASFDTKTDYRSIQRVLNKERNSAGGFIWLYDD